MLRTDMVLGDDSGSERMIREEFRPGDRVNWTGALTASGEYRV